MPRTPPSRRGRDAAPSGNRALLSTKRLWSLFGGVSAVLACYSLKNRILILRKCAFDCAAVGKIRHVSNRPPHPILLIFNAFMACFYQRATLSRAKKPSAVGE